jgi:protein arginine N-methyltransferase 1
MEHSVHAKILDRHGWLVSDLGRVRNYQKAIVQTVRPGDVVVDIGAGTGILSFIACQAGARHAYAIECSPVIELARELCRKNGLQDRVTLFHDMSFNVSLPEKADLIITSTGGVFGPEGGMLGALIDARRRFLKEGGRIIPRCLELFTAPVETPEKYGQIERWKRDLCGFDFSPIRDFAVNNRYKGNFTPQNLLSGPISLVRIPLAEVESTYVKAKASFTAARPGVLHGLAGWSNCELADGLSFTNSPCAPTCELSNAFLPVNTPVTLNKGDQVNVMITTHDGLEWRWQVTVEGEGATIKSPADPKKRFDQSDFWGFPLSRAMLSRKAKPKISRRGEAAILVLSTLQGEKTVAELETELCSRFTDLFPGRSAALAFVAEMIALGA